MISERIGDDPIVNTLADNRYPEQYQERQNPCKIATAMLKFKVFLVSCVKCKRSCTNCALF